LLSRALRINEAARGKEHPETGITLHNLAWTRWKQQRYEEAETLFQRAIRIYTRNYGQDHSRVARLMRHYTEFQQERDQGV